MRKDSGGMTSENKENTGQMETGGQIELVVLDGLSQKLCCLVRNMLLILSERAIHSDHDPAVGS